MKKTFIFTIFAVFALPLSADEEYKTYRETYLQSNNKSTDVSSSSSNHEKCLKASDYKGCMDFQQNKNQPVVKKKKKDCTEEWCSPKEITQETDNLGMKIIPNFFFLDNPEDMSARYKDFFNLYKVKANGEYGRFFQQREIYRVFTKGYSGYSSLSGGGNTNCFSYGSSIDCSTSMPSLVNIPGKSAGVEQIKIDLIYDCLDKTTAIYWDNKLQRWEGRDGRKRKWHKWGNIPLHIDPMYGKDDGIAVLSKICNGEKLKFPTILPSSFSKFEKKIPKKRNYSDKKNVGNINCNSPVWKKKPICN